MDADDKLTEREYRGNLTNQPPGAIEPESLVGQDDGQPHPPGNWTKMRHKAEDAAESMHEEWEKVKESVKNGYDDVMQTDIRKDT